MLFGQENDEDDSNNASPILGRILGAVSEASGSFCFSTRQTVVSDCDGWIYVDCDVGVGDTDDNTILLCFWHWSLMVMDGPGRTALGVQVLNTN